MLSRYQAMNMDRFVGAVETAIAAVPETDPNEAGVIYIAHTVELEEGMEGAVVSYGKTVYTREDHAQSLAEFWQSLLADGKIGAPDDHERFAAHAFTGNPINDVIQIAGALHRKELEARKEKAS